MNHRGGIRNTHMTIEEIVGLGAAQNDRDKGK